MSRRSCEYCGQTENGPHDQRHTFCPVASERGASTERQALKQIVNEWYRTDVRVPPGFEEKWNGAVQQLILDIETTNECQRCGVRLRYPGGMHCAKCIPQARVDRREHKKG